MNGHILEYPARPQTGAPATDKSRHPCTGKEDVYPTPEEGVKLSSLGRAAGAPPWAPVVDPIAARYAAGVMSLLGRADLEVEILQVQQVLAPAPYRDYDLVVSVQVGSLDPAYVGRAALAAFSFALHVSARGRVTRGGLRDCPVAAGELRVRSRTTGEICRYDLRREDAETLADRVILALFERYLWAQEGLEDLRDLPAPLA